MLETIDIETAPRPEAAVIWLHGLGADAHDFESVVPAIVHRGERAWRFVFPNAPIRPVTVNGGQRMRAWYDIKRLDRTETEDLEGFIDTDSEIRGLIAREAGRGIPSSRIVLGGFSQGGAASLYTALRYTEALAGVLALSCYLPLADRLPAERAATSASTPVFIGHGVDDQVLPLPFGQHARDTLRRLGYSVEWHDYPMGHSVSVDEVADIRGFLRRVLP